MIVSYVSDNKHRPGPMISHSYCLVKIVDSGTYKPLL